MHQPIETLSKGFKRRVGLAQAIMHDPAVLVLDEPTDGLDPNQKHEVRGADRGDGPNKAIVISTHILEEVEAMCTRAMIIARGRVVADGTPDELARRSRHHNAVRITALPIGADADDQRRAGRLPRRRPAVEPAVQDQRRGDALIVFPRDGRPVVARRSRDLAQRRAAGTSTESAGVEQGRLDDVFRDHHATAARAARDRRPQP